MNGRIVALVAAVAITLVCLDGPRLVAQTDTGLHVVDVPGNAIVAYAKTASTATSLEETFTFRYRGPSSVVEPFFVNASVLGRNAVEGFVTDLTPSRPGYNYAGTITYQYTDGAGHEQHVAKGRLRSRPYVYCTGHTYRVDAIADLPSGLLTTRVYDIATGPTTFDTSIMVAPSATPLYPGALVRGRPSIPHDLAYGPYGMLPVREHPARRAADYLNYLGYNAAPSGPATTPEALAYARYFPLLLISHVRVPDEARFLPALNAVASYGIDADVLTGRNTTLDGLRTFLRALKNPPEAIELWNEPNNPSMGNAYDPTFETDLPPFAAALATAYPHLNRWGPSMLPDPNGYPGAALVKLRSTVGALITAWNAHSYTLAQPENLGYGGFIGNACGPSLAEDCGWYGSPTFNDRVSAVINPDLPGVTTEGAASYGSYPAICGHSNVDLATQQAYVERGMLYNFKLGHLRVYPYKFLDDGGCSDGFGTYGIISRLTDPNGRLTFAPKPAFTSLVYFDHVLADRGSDARTFTPHPCAYAIDGARADTESLILAESDGTYRLVLWSDKPLWDFNANGLHAAGSPIAPTRTPVTVRYAAAMHATVYRQEPGTGIWSKVSSGAGISTRVDVDQYPLVIAIAPSSVTAAHAGALLPRDVPTPGPTESPR